MLDDKTFEQLFNELYPALCRYSLQFVRRPGLAEEIVQEQFIALWEKRNEIIIHSSYSSYLYTSVKNRSIDYLRSKFAKLKFVAEDQSFTIQDQSTPQHSLEEDELTTQITLSINSLPEKCYTIFSMSRFGMLTNKAIANELNISEKTVENQITIAIKKIKFDLGKYILSFIITFYCW